MAANSSQLLLQRLSNPVADRLIVGTGRLADLPNEALGELDGEDIFVFRNGKWR